MKDGMTDKEYIDYIIQCQGDCDYVCNEDDELCPLNVFCFSKKGQGIPDEDTLKWAKAVKKNKYKITEKLIFDQLL